MKLLTPGDEGDEKQEKRGGEGEVGQTAFSDRIGYQTGNSGMEIESQG